MCAKECSEKKSEPPAGIEPATLQLAHIISYYDFIASAGWLAYSKCAQHLLMCSRDAGSSFERLSVTLIECARVMRVV